MFLLGNFVGNLVVGAAKALAYGGESAAEPGAIEPAHATDNKVLVEREELVRPQNTRFGKAAQREIRV
jgi:hypothetical protein